MAESAAQVIDLDAMLQPIEGDNPAGESLQYIGLYDEIREARRADDNLALGDWQTNLKVADWRKVIDLSVPALTNQSKDIQIGAWLGEALAKQYGFAGARDVMRLLKGFHEYFWDYLYPEIDEGDMEARGNALAWMDRQMALALKETPITNVPGQSYNFIQYEDSKKFDIPENFDMLGSDEQEKYNILKRQAETEHRVMGDMWRKSYNTTRRAFYEDTILTLNECWESYQELDRIMDEKFGNQTPGLGEIRKTLDDIKTAVERFVKEKRIQEPDPSDAVAGGGEVGEDGIISYEGGGVMGGGGGGGPLRSRQDALKRLGEVAEYFRRTEPHSPVAYLVNRAVKWGQMPLDSWLAEVIKDETTLGNLRELLGINLYSSSDDGSGGGDGSGSSWY